MPLEDGVGYGELTELKIEHLEKIYDMHLRITQAVLNRNPYYKKFYRYIDLTAGKGFSPDNKIKGSPLVFLEQATAIPFDKRMQCDLIELEESNLEELKTNMVQQLSSITPGSLDCNINFHLGEYKKVLPTLLQQGYKNDFGLIFVDPSGSLPNFDVLKVAARAKPKMEILIYLSTTNIKRVYHVTHKFLSDYMTDIGKKNWLIRKPLRWDKHKWTFLLGSNTDIFTDYKKISFYRLDSEEAGSFFPDLNLSKKQIRKRNQMPLFDDLD